MDDKRADKNETNFRPIDSSYEEEYSLVLEGILLEYPDEVSEQYLHKYLDNLTIEKMRPR